MTLPDPARSRAILIGAAEYGHLPNIPAARRNVNALQEILTGSTSWNLPDGNCTVVHDPKTPEELVDPIHQGATEATDTLLVYYAGHGLRGESRGELRLTRSTSRSGASHTSTDYNEIREILLAAPALRRIVILDCCYAASALGLMSDPASSIAEEALIEGTYLIAAAGETQAAIADNGQGFTVFTGELVEILQRGIPDEPRKYLDLDLIFIHLHRSLRSKARPLPHKRVRNSLGGLSVSLNAQWSGRVQTSEYAAKSRFADASQPGPWPTVTPKDAVTAPPPVAPGAWPTVTPKDAVTAPPPVAPGAWPTVTPKDTVTAPPPVAPGAWPTVTPKDTVTAPPPVAPGA
ncbi:caspase family protein, partial [Streptomyces erythrochromogenes]|uniref:caspase, EACC1-associated type n=1 Tax=Streptomyces erythrochromogenes TaxID=285574 RepID=UPI003812863D